MADFNFATQNDFDSAVEKLQQFSKLSVGDKIRYVNGKALPDSMESFPLVTNYEGVYVTPNGCTMSVIEAFTPLIDRQSGSGLTTLSMFGIKFSNVETIEMVVSVPKLTEDEIRQAPKGDLSQALKNKALGRLVYRWNPNDGSGLQYYTNVTVMPHGSTPLYWEDSSGNLVEARRLYKPNFKFVYQNVESSLTTPLGLDPKTCTRVRVTIHVRGVWVGKSEAEKFCATMTKLCLDPFVIPQSLNDLIYGGIALFDGQASIQDILGGKVSMLPWAMVYSGQETMKAASSAEEAAQFVKDNTNKSVLRETTDNGLTVDSDSFVDFRNQFVIASASEVWFVRWIDSSLHQVYRKNKSLTFQQLGQGYLVFHKTTARIVNKPLTLETSTQLENLNQEGTGRMFLGLQQVVENISPACAAIAGVLNATTFDDRRLFEVFMALNEHANITNLNEHTYDTQHRLLGKVQILDVKKPLSISLDCEPMKVFESMTKTYGNAFVVKWGDQACLVSPLVAKGLGYSQGGKLELYAKVFIDLCSILTLEEGEHKSAEMAQWWAAHITVITQITKGGESVSMQTKAGLIKKGTRAKGGGVYSAKVGALVGKDVSPGYMYVSSDSPFAVKRGQTMFWWRNPMPFVGIVKVAVVGTDTINCDVEIPNHLAGKATAFNKVYLHPYDVSRTFGDIDGDGIQFLSIEETLQWAINHKEIVKKNPGLWESLVHHNLISE